MRVSKECTPFTPCREHHHQLPCMYATIKVGGGSFSFLSPHFGQNHHLAVVIYPFCLLLLLCLPDRQLRQGLRFYGNLKTVLDQNLKREKAINCNNLMNRHQIFSVLYLLHEWLINIFFNHIIKILIMILNSFFKLKLVSKSSTSKS